MNDSTEGSSVKPRLRLELALVTTFAMLQAVDQTAEDARNAALDIDTIVEERDHELQTADRLYGRPLRGELGLCDSTCTQKAREKMSAIQELADQFERTLTEARNTVNSWSGGSRQERQKHDYNRTRLDELVIKMRQAMQADVVEQYSSFTPVVIPITGTIRGRVLRGGKGVSGASVRIARPNVEPTFTTSGPTGDFKAPGLTPGTYRVSVRVQYRRTERSVTLGRRGVETVILNVPLGGGN